MLTDIKPWYASKGVWGGIIAFGATIAGMVGLMVPDADQAELAELLAVLGGGVGSILALVGRIYASKRVG